MNKRYRAKVKTDKNVSSKSGRGENSLSKSCSISHCQTMFLPLEDYVVRCSQQFNSLVMFYIF